MGWGDDLIWLGEAKHQYLKDGKKRRPTREWVPQPIKEAYLYSPYVDMKGGVPMEERHNQLRPYQGTTDYILKPAELTLTEKEIEIGDNIFKEGSYWIICPDNKKDQDLKNKNWGFSNWIMLTEIIRQKRPNQRILRLKPPFATEDIPYTETLDSPNFRFAVSVARKSDLIITTEGFWHHLAAAWDRKCVVLYGGNNSPYPSVKHKHSGLSYINQCNIIDNKDPKTPCYSRKPDCPHCQDIWNRITPNFVYDIIEEYLKNEKGFDASP